MTAILQEIVQLMVSGITQFAIGFGQGLGALATNIFITEGTDGAQTLSTMGGLIVIFAGISLTIGLSRWVLNFVTSLGARNA